MDCAVTFMRRLGLLATMLAISASGAVATPHGAAVGSYKVGGPYSMRGKTYVPEAVTHYRAQGIASWYGPRFHGKQTANGERYDMHALTAAHPTLPLPSLVLVRNLANQRTLIVRVNDRGPFVGNRLIDLSREAAGELGFRRRGTTKVVVEYLGPAPLDGDASREHRHLAEQPWTRRDDRRSAAAAAAARAGGGSATFVPSATRASLDIEEPAPTPMLALDAQALAEADTQPPAEIASVPVREHDAPAKSATSEAGAAAPIALARGTATDTPAPARAALGGRAPIVVAHTIATRASPRPARPVTVASDPAVLRQAHALAPPPGCWRCRQKAGI
jgi:rare lipoprotein A